MRVRWVHYDAPCVSSGSSTVAEFIGVRPGGRRVHRVSPLCSSGSSGVAGFIRVYPGACRVHVGSLSSLAGFLWLHHRGRRVYPGSLDSMGCTLGIDGFIWCFSVHWGNRADRPVSLGCYIAVVGVRWVHWCAPLGSLGIAGYIVVRPRGRTVHRGRWVNWEDPCGWPG